MLGESLSDPEGSDSGRAGSRMRGLGLLPAVTVFSSQKTRRQVKGSVCAGELAGASVSGYEIHMGETRVANGTHPFARVRCENESNLFEQVRSESETGHFTQPGDNSDTSDKPYRDGEAQSGPQADGCVCGNVFGTYIHGLFDSGELTEKLASYLMKKKGIAADTISVEPRISYKERQYARLADIVRGSLDMEAVYRALR